MNLFLGIVIYISSIQKEGKWNASPEKSIYLEKFESYKTKSKW